jgi:hypothetical protein
MKKKEKKTKPDSKLLQALIAGPWSTETSPMTREEWLASLSGDIDPLKHAGEAWFSTEEYAKPSDIQDPYVRAQVGHEGEYYPESYRRKS